MDLNLILTLINIYIYIDPISILPRFNNSKIEDIWNLYSKKSPLRGIESTNFFSKENSKFLREGSRVNFEKYENHCVPGKAVVPTLWNYAK